MPVAIITGASTGIGAALARELVRRNWKVGLIARRAELLDALVAEFPGNAAAATADVLDDVALAEACRALEATLGPCDLLVANAGSGGASPIHKLPFELIRSTMRLNYDGVVNAVAGVLPGMLARRSGRLAVVSSVASFRGLPGDGAYGASKAAVSRLWECMGIDLRKHGVTCTTINPGFVVTPLTAKNKFPMPFLMSAERAARIIADGLERGRSDITFPWQMRGIGVLMRNLPAWAWNFIASRLR